jgi:hypothetical protein
LTKQDRQRVAFRAPREIANLFVAPEEQRALLLGKRRQTRPGIVRIDRGRRSGTLNA